MTSRKVRGAFVWQVAACAVLLELAGCGRPVGAGADWQVIEPGGETLCATGTPYRFHVRPGDASRVMIFLNGGGACWSGDLCDLGTEPSPYSPFAEMEANNPARLSGVFGADWTDKPFEGWTQVFVPYCTGDAHIGARDVTYTTSAGAEVTIHHRGKANVRSALDWVYANYPGPSRLFISGGSAGAIASPLYAGIVADHYPQAEVVQLADGAGGYRTGAVAAIFETWGVFEDAPDWPELAALDRSRASMEDFFRVTAARHPGMRMAQFNNVDDEVQQQFLALMGTGTPVRSLLRENLADLAAEIPGFRAYSAPGTEHTLLRYDRLFTMVTGRTAAEDWLRNLAEGRDVATVSCEADVSCD